MKNETVGRDLEGMGKRTWEIFVRDPVSYLLAFVVLSILSAISLGILAPALVVGYIRMVRKGLAGEKVDIGDVFDGFSDFGAAFVTGLLVTLGIAVGMFLMVVPGLLVLYFTFFALHFVAYDCTGVGKSLSHSATLVKDNPLLVLLVVIAVSVLFAVGGVVAVGVFLTGPLGLIGATVAFDKIHAPAPMLEAPGAE